MRDGLLTVNQLDPSKTYVFTLGNDSWVPGQEDLRAFADALEEMKDGNSIPTITVSAPMVITEKSNENV